jgi:dienelactone hydrolase
MPDLFDGDPAPNSTAIQDETAAGQASFLEQVKLRAVETAKSFLIDMWLARHTEEKVLPILYKVIDACKEQYADAVKHGDGIYAVGYCIGGRYVLLLGSETVPSAARSPLMRRPARSRRARRSKSAPWRMVPRLFPTTSAA